MCCSEGKTTMPRIKIVMPANPTAIQNKQGSRENIDITPHNEQKLDEFVREAVQNDDILPTIDKPTPHTHETRERSNGRKSR